MLERKTECKGNCTACALTCYCRRKDYNPSWIELERQDVSNRRKKKGQIEL